MTARTTLAAQIAKVRKLINDPAGGSQQFDDDTIQDQLDQNRQDLWYEPLNMAPAIVNAASTNNEPTMIFADYYSDFSWWEADVILQGNSTSTHASWVVLTPTASDLIVGHWSFEASTLAALFATGTYPGQYPPVWATGKSFDIFATAADMCEMWSAYLAGAYDITADGQTLRRSQLMTAKQTLANMFRRQAKPKTVKMVRRDVLPAMDSKDTPVLGGGSDMNGMSAVY